MKVVVACDSFKGSISSTELNECISKALHTTSKNCSVYTMPIGDGGEGTLESLMTLFNSEIIKCEAHDPLMNIITAEYAICGDFCIIEMAKISGLVLVPDTLRNPLKTTTYGLGELISDALKRNIRKFVIGIGGSATNDGGCGMLRALGAKYYDENGKELIGGGEILAKIRSIDLAHFNKGLKDSTFTIACDVNNPMCGPNGASFVYGFQKGATMESAKILDNGMLNYGTLLQRLVQKPILEYPGSGAAGGIGGAFLALFNSELKSGIDLVLDLTNFEEIIRDANLVITGEGKIDEQSFMGKVLGGILKRTKLKRCKVVALCGCNDLPLNYPVDSKLSIFSIQNGPIDLHSAMKEETVKENVQRLIPNIMKLLI
ncbi:glycerate kinase, putative [Entamoeba invadens IP1]|uniref:Glycerate kinase, putative n=1 Tax=Entamoeba invadens IP1 TaxID=370355 RepID=A0A0A1U247_ENTIV|nr:glycerate kinase, putative [Entamoeba invadens IP1]ELP88132.1 glycerate kinase, putative [Entamoeba invadens IP1]|eukprot:XP_004254903.1 glycerate kinase, putative [Entamoeba invadens IP1]